MSGGDNKPTVPDGMTRHCFDPWSYVEFRANGDVAPCPFRPTIGSVREHTLSEILHGEPVRQLRAELLDGKLDHYCAGCRSRKLIAKEAFRIEVARHIETVQLPSSFDPSLYLAANPDVAAAGLDPVRHFLSYGRLEARPLRPPVPAEPKGDYVITFDPELYLQANPDVAKLGVDPFDHFQRYGQYEGRPLRPAPRQS